MPLPERIVVSIPFTGGIDSKTSEHVLPPDRLSILDNGEFTQHGKMRARPGFVALPDVTLAGTQIEGAASVTPLGTKLGVATRAGELLLITDERLYSSDSARQAWIHKGQHFPVTHTLSEVAHVNASQTYASTATAGGITAVIWEDSRGGVRYSVYNVEGAALALDVSIGSSNVSRPWAVPLGTNVLLLWAEHTTNAVRGRLLRPNDLLASVAATHTVLVGDLAASRQYAVASDGTDLFVAYKADGSVVAAGVGLAKITPFGVTTWKVGISADVPTCLDVAYHTGSSRAATGWYDGTSVKLVQTTASTGAVAVAVDTINTLANVVRVACGPCVDASNGNTFTAAYEVSAASTDLHYTVIENAFGGSTIQHAHLASSGFQLRASGVCFFLLGHDSRTGLQNSYYLYSDRGLLSGQMLYQTALDRPSADHLARFWDLKTALGFKRALDAEGTSAVFTHAGISVLTLGALPKPSFAEAGGTAYLSGSCLWAYDGQGVTEANTLMYPDVINTYLADTDLVPSNGTGSMNAGAATVQYNYRWYYEARRANGERIRSSALTVAVRLDAAEDTVTCTLPTLAHTRWRDDLSLTESFSDCALVGYRSIANDTTGIYYKITSDDPSVVAGNNCYLYNDPTNSTVTFVDGLSDALLISREVDYLTRGEIEHIAPPGPALVAAVGDRVWLAGGGIPAGTLRFSKLRFFGEPAEFSDLLSVDDLPEVGGEITKLSYINESAVAFRETGITAIVGDGVNNTGSAGGFTSQAVTADLGCSGVAVVVPTGVMFCSTKGIYQLDQAYNLTYVGAAVERYNAQTFTGGCVLPGTNQVLFTSSETGNAGRSLMFDYVFSQWSTWTLRASDLAVWGETVAVLNTFDDLVAYRDPDSYLDSGSTYNLRARTGPLRLADTVQGFGRLRRFTLLGTYRSAHRLTIGLIYDRDTAPYETVVWDPSTVIAAAEVWGSDTTWGSGDYWGGPRDGNTYQFEHKPMRQKFSSIRFEFSMTPGTNPGAGYELTELALEVALKTGLQRQGATRKY